MTVPLTAEHLMIPRRLAARYAGRGRDTDEMESFCNLALVQAWRNFDPARSPGGDSNLGGWLVWNTEARLRRWLGVSRCRRHPGGDLRPVSTDETRWRQLASLDALAGEGGSASWLARCDCDPARAAEAADLYALAMRLLSPAAREALLLRYRDGLSVPEAARRTGRTAGQLRWLVDQSLAALRERLG